MKMGLRASALKYARLTSTNNTPHLALPLFPTWRLALMDSIIRNELSGGVAANRSLRSSVDRPRPRLRISLPTSRDRTLGSRSSPLLTSTHLVSMTMPFSASTCCAGTLS